MVFCSYFPVLDHGRARRTPCSAPAWFWGSLVVFACAACLEPSSRNLQQSSFCVRECSSTRLPHRLFVSIRRTLVGARPLNLDIDVSFRLNAASKEKVKRKYCKQDYDND